MAITFKRASEKPSALSILKASLAANPARPVSLFKSQTNGAGLMSEKQAATFLGVSVATLQRIRKREQIAYSLVGSRIRYTYDQLKDFTKLSEQPCKISAIKSAASGFPGGPAPKSTTPQHSTAGPDKQTAAALAQTTFKKPKSFSPNS
ncbi:helix-turn-helix domain-containing protein [Rhizobium lentis]|uniref:helix-turn-helix domain-containing protein n=1 Tax=Rhizobium lentis TaxID=1138194 RepID=UPI002180CF80|nr:helix-turn-helix domain-containing protein [Rhizobium lentis]